MKQVTTSELKKIFCNYKVVKIRVDPSDYTRVFIAIDKEHFFRDLCFDKYEYTYHIDDSYSSVLFIEKITKTQKHDKAVSDI